MSIEQVRSYLKEYGKEQEIRELGASSATVELAAQALSVEPARIAKTLTFQHGESCLLIVAAGDTKIDNAKFKAQFGHKATMLSPERALELTGHAVGGICPFALKSPLPVYLDRSLKRFVTVFPACGSSNSAIELSCDELETLSHATAWVDVCKGWQSPEEL